MFTSEHNYNEGEFTNKVITLWYRPPELLLGETRYGTAVDIWSAGCILAEVILGRPMFTGKTDMDQLKLIFDLIGTPTDKNWEGFRQLKLIRTGEVTIDKARRPKLREKYSSKIQPVSALNLLEKLLELDPKKRISARGALTHRYFRVEPIAPNDPTELGKIDLGGDGAGYHEFQTKKRRREAKIVAKKAEEDAKRNGYDVEKQKEAFDKAYREHLKKGAEGEKQKQQMVLEKQKQVDTEKQRREQQSQQQFQHPNDRFPPPPQQQGDRDKWPSQQQGGAHDRYPSQQQPRSQHDRSRPQQEQDRHHNPQQQQLHRMQDFHPTTMDDRDRFPPDGNRNRPPQQPPPMMDDRNRFPLDDNRNMPPQQRPPVMEDRNRFPPDGNRMNDRGRFPPERRDRPPQQQQHPPFHPRDMPRGGDMRPPDNYYGSGRDDRGSNVFGTKFKRDEMDSSHQGAMRSFLSGGIGGTGRNEGPPLGNRNDGLPTRRGNDGMPRFDFDARLGGNDMMRRDTHHRMEGPPPNFPARNDDGFARGPNLRDVERSDNRPANHYGPPQPISYHDRPRDGGFDRPRDSSWRDDRQPNPYGPSQPHLFHASSPNNRRDNVERSRHESDRREPKLYESQLSSSRSDKKDTSDTNVKKPVSREDATDEGSRKEEHNDSKSRRHREKEHRHRGRERPRDKVKAYLEKEQSMDSDEESSRKKDNSSKEHRRSHKHSREHRSSSSQHRRKHSHDSHGKEKSMRESPRRDDRRSSKDKPTDEPPKRRSPSSSPKREHKSDRREKGNRERHSSRHRSDKKREGEPSFDRDRRHASKRSRHEERRPSSRDGSRRSRDGGDERSARDERGLEEGDHRPPPGLVYDRYGNPLNDRYCPMDRQGDYLGDDRDRRR
mmetsp:Transcript_18474/g.39956  ORF Transcript_18474/g.39956 Transcript_18474/m.39956 type:complete len:885 (-) Transcript_18474:4731-7385(-)